MNSSQYLYLSHNTSNLVYHIVCLAKYRRVVFDETIAECPQVKKKLWGGQFWTDGYFVSTVGKNQNETVIKEYVRNQGKQDADYIQLHLNM